MSTTGTTADLAVDPDLEQMMDDVVSTFAGPDVRPDPDAVWATLVEVGLARLTAPEDETMIDFAILLAVHTMSSLTRRARVAM